MTTQSHKNPRTLKKTIEFYLSSTAINILGRLVNFLLIVQVISYLGASQESDWYFFLYGIINIVNSIIYYALESDMVPSLARTSQEKIKDYLRSYFRLSIGLFVLLQVFGIPFSRYLPAFFQFESSANQKGWLPIAVLMFLQPLFNYYAALYASLLQHSGRIILPIMNLAIRSAVVIPFLFFPAENKILYLVVAYTIGETLRVFVLRWNVSDEYKNLFQWKLPKKDDLHAHVKGLGYMIVNMTLINLLLFTDYIMAGSLGAGKATLVEYVSLLKTIPAMVLNGILIYLFGNWSKTSQELKWKDVKKQFFVVVAMGTVLAIGVIVFSDLLLPFIFKKKQFSEEQIVDIKNLFLWFMISSVFYLAIYTLHKVLFVFKKYLFLVKVGTASLVLNILMNYIFMQRYNVQGVAMGTTAVEVTVSIFLYFYVRKLVKASKA